MKEFITFFCLLLWVASPLITINVLALTIKSIEYLRKKFNNWGGKHGTTF